MLIDSATRPLHSASTGFEHDAFIYADDEEFVRRSVSFVRAGIDSGEVVLVAVPKPQIALLRKELGERAGHVGFVDMAEVGRNPARILSLWRDLLDENPGRGVRALSELVYVGRTPAEIQEAMLHEALVNVAFEQAGPFRLRCPFAAGVLSPEFSVAENHPVLLPASGSAPTSEAVAGFESVEQSPAGQSWAAVVEKGFSTPLPAVPQDAERREFGLDDLTNLRGWVAEQARLYGVPGNRRDDLALALHEVCKNSIRFGGGRGTLTLWREGGSLICDVSDNGHITDLLVGRVVPSVSGEGGRGVWLTNQLCDLVQIRSTPRSTQVRLHTTLQT